MKHLSFFLILFISFTALSQPPKMRQIKAPKYKAQVEQQIVQQWSAYSKAFEYSDYEAIVAHFTFPTTVDLTGSPLIFEDAAALTKWYKNARTTIQAGYEYSLLEKSRVIWVTKNLVMLDATYGRFNADYQKIHTGRGIYMYKNTPLGWKMFSMTTLETPVNKD